MDLAGLRDSIARRVVEARVPSFAVGIARDGEVVLLDAFGWADRAARRPATVDTPYSLASVTKPFTGTALTILRDRGMLDLDKPVNEYLDVPLTLYAGKPEEATVRRVANHTAGLPLHYHFFYADEPYRRPPMTESIRRYGIVLAPPGERSQYSNFGYGILDHLISRVSGVPYEEFLRREVLLPLGMTRSAIGVSPELAEHAATRYGSDGVPYPFYDFDHRGGSAIFASARDLLSFATSMLGARRDDQAEILPPSAIEDMFTPTVDHGDGTGYGIGWGSSDMCGFRLHGHSGGMGGVSTMMQTVPSEGIVAVALCNATSPLPGRVTMDVLAHMLPGFEAPKPPSPAPPPPLPEGLIGTWRGAIRTYVGEQELELEIRPGGEIVARLRHQLWTLVKVVATGAGAQHRGRIAGVMHGRIDTPDARKRPHNVLLDLTLRDDVLDGAAVSRSELPDGEGGAPGKRAESALPSWVSLERV